MEDNKLIREHFTVLGLPKVKRTRENAERYAAEMDLAAYPCSFCEFWHVGQYGGWEAWDNEK